ncbi:hypothetical protein EDB80DRAFT_289891 [Ilyonectria destructans]|nr:hypothetical protein EDB80DRAFT_289891 [Ilyonectria destructans]
MRAALSTPSGFGLHAPVAVLCLSVLMRRRQHESTWRSCLIHWDSKIVGVAIPVRGGSEATCTVEAVGHAASLLIKLPWPPRPGFRSKGYRLSRLPSFRSFAPAQPRRLVIYHLVAYARLRQRRAVGVCKRARLILGILPEEGDKEKDTENIGQANRRRF